MAGKALVPADSTISRGTKSRSSPACSDDYDDTYSEASMAKPSRLHREQHSLDTDDDLSKGRVDISNASQRGKISDYRFSSDNRFVATRSKELNQRGRSHSVVVKLHKVSRSDTTSMEGGARWRRWARSRGSGGTRGGRGNPASCSPTSSWWALVTL